MTPDTQRAYLLKDGITQDARDTYRTGDNPLLIVTGAGPDPAVGYQKGNSRVALDLDPYADQIP